MSFGSCFQNPLGSKIRKIKKPLLSSLPPDSRPWFTNEMQNVLLSVKMTLDHWATVHLFSSLAQVRCFWRCFCFRSLQLLSTPCEALPSVWTGFAWQYSSSLLLVHLFLPIFFFSVNFAFIMLWYSVHSVNSHTFQEWPSVTYPLCGGCQWCLLDHCHVSILPYSCGFKEQAKPGIYTVGMVI